MTRYTIDSASTQIQHLVERETGQRLGPAARRELRSMLSNITEGDDPGRASSSTPQFSEREVAVLLTDLRGRNYESTVRGPYPMRPSILGL